MAKESAKAAAGQADTREIALSLDEYCTRRSQVDRRVELIAAFNHHETGAGHLSDLASAYDARFEAFINQPA